MIQCRRTRGVEITILLWLVYILPAEPFQQKKQPSCYNLESHLLLRQQHVAAIQQEDDNTSAVGVRLNKVFKATHSRRQADDLIASGRVTVNGAVVSAGQRVVPFRDVVQLDGKRIENWEALNAMSRPNVEDTRMPRAVFEYTKYWKPTGVVCTTDQRIRDNIIDVLRQDGYSPEHRVYPVGRLDRDTSGLILLTSDGRLPNAALRGEHKQPKTYHVGVDRFISNHRLDELRSGVVITTVAQRDGNRAPPLTAKTNPCIIKRIDERSMYMTITEGRNRQIRKMLDAVGHSVVWLERISFAGLELDPLEGPGDWRRLDEKEMQMIRGIIEHADADNGG
ncbi:hypothetical protein MPSEU_000077400 [Mayamaea pseudoterrestris]|nr:hypothetical protein MPSEU_000077400 [Mayamaea pseudoterrestris]